MTLHDKVQCAGQSCEERDGCARYERRGAHEWVSFDIERAQHGNYCAARIEFAGPAKRPNGRGNAHFERPDQGETS